MKNNLLIIVCLLLINVSAHANDIPLIDCMIEPNSMVELSSSVSGVLDTILVDRSDKVKKDQIIATLKADVEIVDVKTSEERLKLINAEHQRAIELYSEKAITLSDKDKSDSEKILSELELKHAKAHLDLRQIKSPIDGVVVKRYVNPGEFVENKPILELAQLNPLKIEVVSPILNYGKITKGMHARVLPEFGEYRDLIAEVVIVDKVIDAASGTFGVRLELDNSDYSIPGGLKCKVQFLHDSAPAITKKKEIRKIEVVQQEDGILQAQTTGAVTNLEVENKSRDSDALSLGSENDSEFDSDESSVEKDSNESLMCITIGAYKKQDAIDNLISVLDKEIIKFNLRTEVETKTKYHVRSNVFRTPKQANRQMKKMKAANIVDMALMNDQDVYRISLGLYSQKPLAVSRVKTLSEKGYKVSITPLKNKIKTYWADIAYLPQSDEVLSSAIVESRRRACSASTKQSLLR